MLLGLEYLHNKDIIHRDIKLENLLIGDDNTIKICDFGCCSKPGDRNRNIFCGTVEYMAPEIIKKQYYDCSVDIWSLGIVAYEMVHKHSPFKAPTNQATFRNILAGDYHVSSWVTDKYTDFISKCLTVDSNYRWSAKRLLEHPLIEDLSTTFRKRPPTGDEIDRIALNYELELHTSVAYYAPKENHRPTQGTNLGKKQVEIQSTRCLEKSAISCLGQSKIDILAPPQTEKVSMPLQPRDLNTTENRLQEAAPSLNDLTNHEEIFNYQMEHIADHIVNFFSGLLKEVGELVESSLDQTFTEVRKREARPRQASQNSQKDDNPRPDHRQTTISEPNSNTPSVKQAGGVPKEEKSAPNVRINPSRFEQPSPDESVFISAAYETSHNRSTGSPNRQQATEEKGFFEAIFDMIFSKEPQKAAPPIPQTEIHDKKTFRNSTSLQ